MRKLLSGIVVVVMTLGGAFRSSAAGTPEPSAVPAAVASLAASDSLATIGVGESMRLGMPLDLTAGDFVTKVYGVIDPAASRGDVVRQAEHRLAMTPAADEFGLWLEKEDGYAVRYYGMEPDVTAMARFDNDSVSDFGFFFLFPYEDGRREEANRRQAEFCGSLLQEMHDIGLVLGVNSMSDALFEAMGDYAGRFVEVRLIEEKQDAAGGTPDSDGRFVLILSVEPGAFTAADELRAQNE